MTWECNTTGYLRDLQTGEALRGWHAATMEQYCRIWNLEDDMEKCDLLTGDSEEALDKVEKFCKRWAGEEMRYWIEGAATRV